jgi:alkanesulfonate monooxygenase SsuD/methylene tetrahydromethanopterin reductase-like flavin-dependent oxidoreductase (luciferase family)
MKTMSIGIAFTPFETRADLVVRLGSLAEQRGLDGVGVAEGWTHDSTVLLTELAMRTLRVELGTFVLPVWGRTPGTIALAAAGLQRSSGGRFTLGLGASSPPLTEGFHGVPFERPVSRLRETVTAVRALLSGERLPNPAGGARPLRLGAVPEQPVPIALAGLSPGSIRLAGELADAWAPFLWARSRLSEGLELVREGEARAERPLPTRAAIGVPVALGPDEESARRMAAWWLTTYATRMGPLYPRMLAERFGMSAGVGAVVEAAGAGREPDLPVAAEELAREVTLMGTYDETRDAIASWRAAGADSVHLVLPPGRPEAELTELVEVVAAAARAEQVALRPAAA